ncbi:hypothetical protein [Mycolicibacterium goodii]|uniref:hypothetical protein n=1 Tax=Mycolicibacterium goodii TaxID=134601 RepID=UPI001BDC3EC7|nr:hypothetical protein [Mycolicibacterium goodii]MBU8833297.1 hypothetical protein [Mycolicibacterium goodii]
MGDEFVNPAELFAPCGRVDDGGEVFALERGGELGRNVVVHGAERSVGPIFHPVVDGFLDALFEVGRRWAVVTSVVAMSVDSLRSRPQVGACGEHKVGGRATAESGMRIPAMVSDMLFSTGVEESAQASWPKSWLDASVIDGWV